MSARRSELAAVVAAIGGEVWSTSSPSTNPNSRSALKRKLERANRHNRQSRAAQWLALNHRHERDIKHAAAISAVFGPEWFAAPENQSKKFLSETPCTKCEGYLFRVDGTCESCGGHNVKTNR